MKTIQRYAFSMQADTTEQLRDNLIKVAGYTVEGYISQMSITADILDQNPIWVQNHLADIINANLVHLGYIMKDTRTAGMMGEYNSAYKDSQEASINNENALPQITINPKIIAEDGTINISYLFNATKLLKDNLNTVST